MTIDDVAELFAAAGTALPRPYEYLLRNPGAVPSWFQADIYTNPDEIVLFNKELRESGFFDHPWPHEFVALGTDPGGNAYFTDTRDTRCPVYIANHELLSGEALTTLDCAEPLAPSLGDLLAALTQRNAEIEDEAPYSVFSAGQQEFERLCAEPGRESLDALFWSRARPLCALDGFRRERIRRPLFDYMFVNLEPHVCFALIGPATDILLAQDDDCLFAAALTLLSQIAAGTDTSEMPADLHSNWQEIAERVARHRLEEAHAWAELKAQYRRRGVGGP